MGQFYDIDYNNRGKDYIIMILETYRGVIPDYEEMLVFLGLDPYDIYASSADDIKYAINFFDKITFIN